MQKKQVKKPKLRRRNAMEVLSAFTGFLGMRDQPIIFSKKHDMAPVAELVIAFQRANRLPNIRDNSPVMKVPQHLDHVTNEQRQTAMCAVSPPPPSMEDAIKLITRTLSDFSTDGQNVVLAGVLQHVRERRDRVLARAEEDRNLHEHIVNNASNQVRSLEKILRGDVATVYLRSNLNDTTNG